MCTICVGIDHRGGFAHIGAGSKWKVSESLLNIAVNLKLVFYLFIIIIFFDFGNFLVVQ